MLDNAEECRERLFAIWKEAHETNVKADGMPEKDVTARYVLDNNTIVMNLKVSMEGRFPR